MLYKKRQNLLLIKESASFIFFSFGFYFIVILTNEFGWLILKISSSEWFLLKKTSLQTLALSSKSFIKLFNYTNFSLFKPYVYYLKVIGRGYKFTFKTNKLVMRIGFSHKIIFKVPKNITFYFLKRYNFFLYGRSFLKIRNLMYKFLFLKKKSLYKRKGLFSKGTYFKLKKNNKKKLY
jgi:hypothetical protein